MAKGDLLTVCDMHMTEYECSIADFEAGDVLLEVISSGKGDTEPPYRVTLFQALPKSDKMDFIVQKAVELGVWEIVPFISERCISRPDAKTAQTKLARWNKIALEAAKQCGRGIIPQVRQICSFKQALSLAAEVDCPLLFYEGDTVCSLKGALSTKSADVYDTDKPLVISAMIGSEGGFAQAEVEMASACGMIPTGLGKRILRCETAPIVALSAISYAFEL